ncbi:MAG TPA: hypothetical protein VK607_10635 [Kofleriaceae bacterium]|nr:hypothetical protein [Kofleriaceae bacterium]
MTSPTQRTLDLAKRMGWMAGVVERWIGPPDKPRLRKLRDLFGFIDIVIVDYDHQGALGIQATGETSSGNVSNRIAKIQGECLERARRWLCAGNRLEVWGWAKRGAREKKRWRVRVVRFSWTITGPLKTVECEGPEPVRKPRAKRKTKQQQIEFNEEADHG